MADTSNNPGYKTSEFWVTAVTSAVVGLITLLNQSGFLHGFQIPDGIVLTIIIPAVSYVLGRFGLKMATVTANAKVDVAKANAESTAPVNKIENNIGG